MGAKDGIIVDLPKGKQEQEELNSREAARAKAAERAASKYQEVEDLSAVNVFDKSNRKTLDIRGRIAFLTVAVKESVENYVPAMIKAYGTCPPEEGLNPLYDKLYEEHNGDLMATAKAYAEEKAKQGDKMHIRFMLRKKGQLTNYFFGDCYASSMPAIKNGMKVELLYTAKQDSTGKPVLLWTKINPIEEEQNIAPEME